MYPLITSKYLSFVDKGRNIAPSHFLAQFNRNDGRTNVTHTHVMSIVHEFGRARLAIALYSSAMYPDARDFMLLERFRILLGFSFAPHLCPRSHLHAPFSPPFK